jgi:hypothetical protein
MLMSTLIFLFLCLVAFLLPDNYWLSLADLYQRFKSFTYSQRRKGPISQGELWFQYFERVRTISVQSGTHPPSSSYKFYSELYLILENLWRERGIPLQKGLFILIKSLRLDLKGEKKRKAMLGEAKIQSLIMMIFLWGYAFCFTYILKVSPSYYLWIGVFIWQLIGIFVHKLLLVFIQNKLFSEWSLFFSDLIKATVLVGTPLSIGEVSSHLSTSSWARHKGDFMSLKLRFDQLWELWRERGAPIQQGLNELSQDMLFVMEQKEEKFQSLLKGLNLLWSVVFIIPPFFALVLGGVAALFIE